MLYSTVVLIASNPATSLNIQGPKGGILVGTIVDAVTDAPLNACLEVRWAKNSSEFWYGPNLVNTKYRLLVVPNTDVFIKVWSEGHKSWYYPGTIQEVQSKPLNLRPGQEKKTNIRLEPAPDGSSGECGVAGAIVNP